jgi:hypothetical protein
MSDDPRLEKMAEQVNTIHTVLLGADDQGGLVREVQAIKRDVDVLKGFRAQVAGMAALASAAISLGFAKLFGK